MSKVEWIEPVFDRTYADVEFAKRKIAEWIEENVSTVYELKGCLNVSDMNRIENNIKYLSDILSKNLYIKSLQTKKWNMDSVVMLDDVRRILDNVTTIVENFHKPIKSKSLPYNMGSYIDINTIEEILFYVKELVDDMEGCYQISDTFYSGSKRILPLKKGVK